LQPLKEWLERKGYITQIATQSEIEENYTWEAASIENPYAGIDGYIKNAYDNWELNPSYLLLVGDSDITPTHY